MCGFSLHNRDYSTITARDIISSIHIFPHDEDQFGIIFDVLINKDDLYNGFHEKLAVYLQSLGRESLLEKMHYPIIVQTERITDTSTVVLVCESPEGIVIDRSAVDELKSQKVKDMILDNNRFFDAFPDIFNAVRFEGAMPDRNDVLAVQHWYEYDKWDERVVRNAIHTTMWKIYDIARRVVH